MAHRPAACQVFPAHAWKCSTVLRSPGNEHHGRPVLNAEEVMMTHASKNKTMLHEFNSWDIRFFLFCSSLQHTARQTILLDSAILIARARTWLLSHWTFETCQARYVTGRRCYGASVVGGPISAPLQEFMLAGRHIERWKPFKAS